MAKANEIFFILTNERVIHAPEGVYADLNRSLCLTFRLKKKKKWQQQTEEISPKYHLEEWGTKT